MRLIFRLGTCQPRGLNADISLHLKFACACKTQLSLNSNSLPNHGATHNEHSTDEGHSPETSGHLVLRFWHFHFIYYIYFFVAQI